MNYLKYFSGILLILGLVSCQDSNHSQGQNNFNNTTSVVQHRSIQTVDETVDSGDRDVTPIVEQNDTFLSVLDAVFKPKQIDISWKSITDARSYELCVSQEDEGRYCYTYKKDAPLILHQACDVGEEYLFSLRYNNVEDKSYIAANELKVFCSDTLATTFSDAGPKSIETGL